MKTKFSNLWITIITYQSCYYSKGKATPTGIKVTKSSLLKLSIFYITYNSESKTQPHSKAHSLFQTYIH